jgi:hypothetical protein
MTTTYQKIPGLYKFDPETRQYTDQATSPELDALWDVPIWNFTEKIDGTNIRVIWDGYRVQFAGRTDNAQIPPKLLAHLQDKFGGPEMERVFEEKFGVPEAGVVVLYGEGYGPKIQKGGGNYGDEVSFILFDVKVGSYWLLREAIQDIADYFVVPIVPLVLENVEVGQAIMFVQDGFNSVSGKPGVEFEAEGLVGVTSMGLLNRAGHRISVKVKGRDLR